MKKSINKIIAIGIGVSMMGGSIVPAFAAETSKSSDIINKQVITTENNSIINGQVIYSKPIITLEKVINAAIDNSDKLVLKSKEIKLYRDKMKLQEKTNDFYESINQNVYDFPYDKLELQEKQTKQSQDFLEDQIANDITGKYNAIVMKQLELRKAKTNLEIKNKELDIVRGKVGIGMATDNQLNDKQIEIKSVQDDIKAKEDSLKNNIDYLGVLTNLNLSNYTLDQNIEYNVFRINGSVDEYLDDKIDAYLKYNDEMIKLTKDYFDDLKDNGLKGFGITVDGTDTTNLKDIASADIPQGPPAMTYETDALGNSSPNYGKYAVDMLGYQKKVQNFSNALTMYSSYLDGKYTLAESEVKLDDSKKSLKNGLKECYSTLLDMENKINTLKEQINSTNTKLRYAKTQVDIGVMTENNYKALVLKSEDLDTSLRQLINTYNTLKDSIQKPWILNNK